MNRRRFLTAMGLVPAAAAVPKLPESFTFDAGPRPSCSGLVEVWRMARDARDRQDLLRAYRAAMATLDNADMLAEAMPEWCDRARAALS